MTFLLSASTLLADDSWIRASGSLGLSSDYYDQNGLDQSRLPSFVHRASFRTTITLFNQIDLPFEAYVTSNSMGYRQPFNQFGVNPRIGSWLTLHAGYFSTRFSDLTFGDARILGGGFDLTPGNVRISAFYGLTREARNPDPVYFYTGEYERRCLGVKLGYGSNDGINFGISVMHAQDEIGSIRADSTTQKPQENLATSMQFSVAAFDNFLRINTEGAISVFTSDRTAPLTDSTNRILVAEQAVGSNISTSIDGAFKAGLQITPSQRWNVRFDAQWIGPGFVTLGYVQMPNDVLDLSVAPSARLFDNALFIRLSYGKRTNNLRNTLFAPTTRTIGSLNLSANFNEHLGMDLMYSNYGMKSTHVNDTLKVSNISQMYMISPRASFDWLGGVNTASMTIMYQNSDDANQYSAASVNNTSSSVSVVHSISLPSKLSLTTTAFYNAFSTAAIQTKITTVNETASYSLHDNMIMLSATLGFNIVHSTSNSTQLMARISSTLNLEKWGSFTLSLMNNSYDYNTVSGIPSYRELQASLQYSISF